LLRLLWAIRDGEDVHVLYQSMRQPAATERWIAPHALASDGLRWHVRAWCQESLDFRDFVLSRVQRILGTRPSSADSTKDENWQTRIDVILRPRPELVDGQRSAIEADYGMKHGRLVLNCRKALVFYVLRQLQLDRSAGTTAIEQPLELENRAELSALIAAGRKVPDKLSSARKSRKEP
jgi:predicted DNA-binding transcriptional regulator YafY